MFLISEGSCDFEDWSNNAEYSVYLKYIQTESLFYLFFQFHLFNFTFILFTVFLSNKCRE